MLKGFLQLYQDEFWQTFVKQWTLMILIIIGGWVYAAFFSNVLSQYGVLPLFALSLAVLFLLAIIDLVILVWTQVSLKYTYFKVSHIAVHGNTFAVDYSWDEYMPENIKRLNCFTVKEELINYKYVVMEIEFLDGAVRTIHDNKEGWTELLEFLEKRLNIQYSLIAKTKALLQEHPFFSPRGREVELYRKDLVS